MRLLAVIVLVAFVATARSSSLLEMSQTLWSKLLQGGLTKIGALDPLTVPVVKVDQSEGNTSYRMILRSVEIIGLNASSLESVHIGRGRLKTNLTEHEAGYVSYTDQRKLDTIRYRFHTVVKEPKGQESQNLEVLPLEGSEGSRTSQGQYGRVRNYEDSSRSRDNYQTSSRYQESRHQEVPQGYRSSSRYQDDQSRRQEVPQGHQTSSRYQEDQSRRQEVPQGHQTSSRYQNDQSRRHEVPQGHQTSSRYQDDQSRRQEVPQGHQTSSRYQDDLSSRQGPQGIQSSYDSSRIPEVHTRYYSQPQDSQKTSGNLRTEYQIPQRQESSRFSSENTKSPGRVRIVYAERYHDDESRRNQGSQDDSQARSQGYQNSQTRSQGYENSQTRSQPQGYSQTRNQGPINGDCLGSCHRRNQGYPGARDNLRDEGHKDQEGDIGVAASMTFESRRPYVNVRTYPRGDQVDSMTGQNRHNDGPINGNSRYAANYDPKVNESNNQRKAQRYQDSSSQTRLENQPGYVDIVYADDKDQKIRRFGNLKVESGRDTTVYSLDDVLRDLRDHRRFIIHNFTEGEALAKKNDAVRTAQETKRIKDLLRYARDFQEMQGYYEQGMQLIYHYGDKDDEESVKVKDGQRTKRAHLDDDAEEDDIMHVIMRIRVPVLQVNAGYVLMGKVGKQVLRGNGLLNGNFTELIGDFTLELRKVDEDTMVVRAARARLSARDKKITLQGMDEEGPVKEILTHGLMAAEAVAAMLADDLATKALSEKTADSIIYRMYKNLPAVN